MNEFQISYDQPREPAFPAGPVQVAAGGRRWNLRGVGTALTFAGLGLVVGYTLGGHTASLLAGAVSALLTGSLVRYFPHLVDVAYDLHDRRSRDS